MLLCRHLFVIDDAVCCHKDYDIVIRVIYMLFAYAIVAMLIPYFALRYHAALHAIDAMFACRIGAERRYFRFSALLAFDSVAIAYAIAQRYMMMNMREAHA